MEIPKTALIITGSLVQDHEFIYPYYRLKEEGYDITVALKDGCMAYGYKETKIPCDDECRVISYEELTHDYDLLIVPGGAKCMEYLRQEKNVIEFIKRFRKKIGCICHGTQLLISANRVKGLKVSGYYSIRDDINNAGGIYIDGVVKDKNIITCPHYKYLGRWMKKILKD